MSRKSKRNRGASRSRPKSKRAREQRRPKVIQEIRGQAQWEARVLEAEKPVVVDFWAPWCGPCRTMAPILERVAAAYEGSVDFAKVDTQSNPGIARDFNVRSIPTLLVLYQGRVVDVSVGLTSAEALHRMIRRALDQHEGVGLLAKLRRLWG